MPDKRTTEKAREDLREGKSASTAAGEFVHREIDKIREGEHGAKNAKQAIAIGLSEARRAGVPIGDNPNRRSRKRKAKSARRPTRSTARRSTRGARRTSAKRSRAALRALKRQPRRAASHLALSRQAHRVARKRTAASRSASARKAARTRAARSRSSGARRSAARH
jgi:uncharacterized protein DUF6496